MSRLKPNVRIEFWPCWYCLRPAYQAAGIELSRVRGGRKFDVGLKLVHWGNTGGVEHVSREQRRLAPVAFGP
jgi:hypothetical protein